MFLLRQFESFIAPLNGGSFFNERGLFLPSFIYVGTRVTRFSSLYLVTIFSRNNNPQQQQQPPQERFKTLKGSFVKLLVFSQGYVYRHSFSLYKLFGIWFAKVELEFCGAIFWRSFSWDDSTDKNRIEAEIKTANIIA